MSLTVETARDTLIDTFDDIGVRVDETALEASDERIGIKAINRIMAKFAANGVNLGFTKLTNIADVITIPEGAHDALITILGLRLWPKYRSVAVPIEIIKNARDGEKQMYRMGIVFASTKYPSTLPMGSGNVPDGYDNYYAGDIVDSILAESNESISLEDDTE